MAVIDDETSLSPPGIISRDKKGTCKAVEPSILGTTEAADHVRESEMTRFHIMLFRAQDACRELLVGLSAWLVSLKELHGLCAKTPEEVSKQLKYNVAVAIMAFGNRREEVDKLSSAECEIDGPTLSKIVYKCIVEAQREFNLLTKNVNIVTKELRKLTNDLQKPVQELSEASKKTARDVIRMQQEVVTGTMESEEIIARIKAQGAS